MRAGRWKATVGVLLVVAILVGGAFWARPVNFFRAFGDVRLLVGGGQSRYTTIEGYRVHYYLLGPATGPAVVLVHGLGGQAQDWTRLSPYFVNAGYRVYLPDLPGYGESERPANFSYSVPEEAKIVVGFMDGMGLKQVDLGGWSMGGWIVQLVANDHPERVRRLMLFDSAGIYAKPVWDTRLFTPTTADQLEELDVLLMPHPPKLPGFVAEYILRTSHSHAWVIRRALDSMLQGHDTTDALLPKLKMPVLIVWGQEDKITPLEQGQKMHRLIPQSQFEVFPGCGHLAPNDCANEIGPKVMDFLRQ